MAISSKPILFASLLLVLDLELCFGHNSGSCQSLVHDSPSSSSSSYHHHHHLHNDDDHSQCSHGHHHRDRLKLPEELAEEEDLELYGFGQAHGFEHDLDAIPELSNLSLWMHAMGCSLLVSMASLICLVILPVLLFQGKPSKIFVDSLAAFGAGAMLGDAFLHQLPHAFGGGHSHSHDHHVDHNHNHLHQSESHAHSLKDLSVGLSTLSGILLFLLVEKVVRYVEDHSGNVANAWGHGHHHHSHKKNDDIKDTNDDLNAESLDGNNENKSDMSPETEVPDGVTESCLTDPIDTSKESLRQRVKTNGAIDEDKQDLVAANGSVVRGTLVTEKTSDPPCSSLVFGYLNLFSDGVHNFTDGMALGSAFLLHGSVGGWSRTLFLLAHEIPQEVGDFGILVRSGFSVTKALFFNFLSALVALAGTALALLFGQDPGQSSLIEGFTAGGFIYIAVAGVLPEMNTGKSTCKSSAIQLISLILGMGVALFISLIE